MAEPARPIPGYGHRKAEEARGRALELACLSVSGHPNIQLNAQSTAKILERAKAFEAYLKPE